MAVLLSHIQNFSRPPADNSASEGELLPEHQGQKNGGEREPGEIGWCLKRITATNNLYRQTPCSLELCFSLWVNREKDPQ